MGTYAASKNFEEEIRKGHNPTIEIFCRDLRKWNEEECECLEKMYQKNYKLTP